VITIKKNKNSRALKDAVELLSGVDLSVCFQCKKCSSGCPVGKLAKTRPSEIMRSLHLGAGNELLESDLVWMCASCETCSARCPMGIDVAAVMDALRRLALARGASKQKGNVPLFNRAFLKTVETFGRSYEIGMITAYKIGTMKLMNDTEKFPAMLKKGKIALLPPRGGDKQTVIASVSNMTGTKAECTVDASATGGEIVGAKSQKVSVDPGKSAPVYFEVKPSSDESVAFCSVEMKVSSPNGTDGVKHRVPLKYFGRKTILPLAVAFTPKDETKQVPFILPSKFAEPKCEVRLYPGSGEALRESLQYLAGYPYGCIEQTMSKFMPLLAAKQAGYINAKLSSDLPAMVAEGIRLIKSHQMSDGGFGWYGEKGSDPMMSAYVYRGLAISKKLFGKMDNDLISRTRYYLYNSLDRNVKNTFEKAYIIFSLSEGEKVQKSMMDSLMNNVMKEGTYAKTLAVLACLNVNDPRGTMLYELALKEYQFSAKKSAERKEDWTNDTVETASALLYASVKLGRDSAAEDIARDLVSMRSGLAWKNSRDTAWAVIALSEKLKKYRETASPSNISVAINGAPAQSVRVTATEVDRGSTIINVPASNLRTGANSVSISKSGSSAVYATVLVTYTDRSDSFSPIANGFDLSRTYYLVAVNKDKDEIKLALKESKSFSTGDLVMVEVKLKKAGDIADYLMLEDPLPAGFSVVRNDGDYFSDKVKKEYGTKQAYDDRTVFFIRGPVNASTVRYFIRADIPGSYRTLPSSVSRMYYPEWNGSSSDNTLTVGK